MKRNIFENAIRKKTKTDVKRIKGNKLFSIYRGTPINMVLQSAYVLANGNNSLCLLWKDLPIFLTDFVNLGMVWYKDEQGTRKLSMMSNLKNLVHYAMSKQEIKYIAIPIYMAFENENSMGNDGHSNIFIIQKTHNSNRVEIERFEPHGSGLTWYDLKELDDCAFNAFREIFGEYTRITYYKTKDYCPAGIFQSRDTSEYLDPLGFCQAWIMWYLHVRTKHINLTRDQVVQKYVDFVDIRDFIDVSMDYIKRMINIKRRTIYKSQVKRYIDQKITIEMNNVIFTGLLRDTFVPDLYSIVDENYKTILFENKDMVGDINDMVTEETPLLYVEDLGTIIVFFNNKFNNTIWKI